MKRLLCASMMIATLLLAPAGAHGLGGGCVGAAAGLDVFNTSADCESSSTHTESIGQTVSASSGVTYSYLPLCVRGEGITGNDFYGCGDQLACGQDGHLFYVLAHLPSGAIENRGEVCFQPNEVPAAASVTPGAVLRAFKRVPLPDSEVVIQPPGGKTLVNLDTVFSTRAEGFTRTIGLLGHRVELDITPSEFRWVNGDGTVQVTDWAGRPWREGTPLADLITHRYDDAVHGLRPRVDTTWSARYRVDGGPWRDVPGTVTITGSAYDLAVLSASPALTS